MRSRGGGRATWLREGGGRKLGAHYTLRHAALPQGFPSPRALVKCRGAACVRAVLRPVAAQPCPDNYVTRCVLKTRAGRSETTATRRLSINHKNLTLALLPGWASRYTREHTHTYTHTGKGPWCGACGLAMAYAGLCPGLGDPHGGRMEGHGGTLCVAARGGSQSLR